MLRDLVKVWTISYVGNFVGAVVWAWLFYMTGYVVGDMATYIEKVTFLKTSATFSELGLWLTETRREKRYE